MIPLFNLSLTKSVNKLSDVVTDISKEVSSSEGGIWKMLKYFSTNPSSEKDIKVMEDAVRSIHNIHKELDDILTVCNDLLNLQGKINTYLSKSISEGDDLK